MARPHTTSDAQWANSTTRVVTSAPPTNHAAFRLFGGNSEAAKANAPIWIAWPDGKASKALPDKGMPCKWPRTVRRSGRICVKTDLSRCGRTEAATVVRRTWSLA